MSKYYVVTTISQHRNRYVIPVDSLQKENPDSQVSVEWAEDEVICDDAEEFSQVWLGETIIDSTEIDEEQALQMFDRENEHLQTWSRDQKLKYMHDWKSKEW
jgi:hypothetical protein